MIKKINIIFILLIITKMILSFSVLPVLGFADSLNYINEAKAFHDTNSLSEVAKAGIYPPIYSIIISPAFIFKDMEKVHFSIKVINAIISSSIIFPIFFLANRFFSKKKSLIIATITALVPPIFAVSSYTMSENIFFPLFITTLYIIYLTIKEKQQKLYILSGILIGLCYLTRAISIFLILVIIIIFLLNKTKIKNIITSISASLITILPWIYTKIKIYGFSLQGILGNNYSSFAIQSQSNIIQKLIWVIFYTDYLILSTGIIFFILTISLISNYKNINTKILFQLTLLSTIFSIILASNLSGAYPNYEEGRLIGRYIEPIIPMFILLGFISLKKSKKITIFTLIFLNAITPLILFNKFFPVNNMSLVSLGTLAYLSNSTILIAIIIIVTTILILKIKEYNFKKIAYFFIIYFIIISLLNSTVIIYDSKFKWEAEEGIELGIWINDNLPKNNKILIDKDEPNKFTDKTEEKITDLEKRSIHTLEYWIRFKYKIGPIEKYPYYEYIITKKDLPLKIIKEGKEGTKIYYNIEYSYNKY
ncbi:MAG TPA: glycosyltransferase family 39 protein [Candidatus Nanoarchaeia archaeon]|nr:glycosyltransferase family 39 protein [Candidatus Nanoarchaeia archaeon]